jgi:hypothetical protein
MRATIPVLRRLAAVSLAVAAVPAQAGARQIPDLPAVRVESVYGLQPTTSSFPIARLDDGQASGDLDRVAAGTLTFAHPLPVRDVLFLMFRGTSFSVVLDPAVNGTFTGELTDLTLRQALEAVVVPAGLDFQRRGRVVNVFPRRAETRLFEVSMVDAARSWRRQASGAGSAGEVTATVATDFFGELGAGVQALLSPSGKMHVDRAAGIVQVTDFADRLQQVGVYIEAVTLRATRQVRLSARVLDVALSDKAIDWAAVARDAGLSMGARAGIQIDDFDRVVRAIGAFGTVRTIASPQILATNNQPALLRVGAPEGGPGGDSQAVPATFALSITPQIGADGIVHMIVSPAYGDEHRSRSTRLVTEADSVMRVRGGETAVIAGLIRESGGAGEGESAAGGPDQKTGTRVRRELVVLLTPTVVSAGSAPALGAQ